ncbi:MAG: radical SAM protein [Ignisphaera sp.]
MRFRIVEITISNALSRSGLPDLDYALNPYIGCSHRCLYCYARDYVPNREVVDNWGYVIYVKKNLLDVLEREVKRFRKGVVGLGTITDGYQPVEALYKLSIRSIEILVKNEFKVSIQTKSSLILRDLDVLKRYRSYIDVGITITSTKNDSPMKSLEVFSSPPSARIEALKRLASEGIKTWIFLGPIIPGYNDDITEISEVLNIARETNSIVYFDKLRVKSFMWRNRLLSQLAKKAIKYDWNGFFKQIFDLCKSLGVECRYAFESEEREKIKTLDLYRKSIP